MRQIRNLLIALVELHPQGRDTRRVLSRAAALSAAGGNKTQAASLLGISRFQLLRKLGREDTGEISDTNPVLPIPPTKP